MTAMISLNKLSSSPNVNVNVKPNVNVNVGGGSVDNKSSVDVNQIESDQTVKYGDSVETVSKETSKEETSKEKTDTSNLKEKLKASQNECQALKIYIDMLKNNPLIYHGYIIADDELLMKFVQLLTSADDIQLDAEDIGEGCFSRKKYRKVHAIYVIKNNETKNLKYFYGNVVKELNDLRISIKFVF